MGGAITQHLIDSSNPHDIARIRRAFRRADSISEAAALLDMPQHRAYEYARALALPHGENQTIMARHRAINTLSEGPVRGTPADDASLMDRIDGKLPLVARQFNCALSSARRETMIAQVNEAARRDVEARLNHANKVLTERRWAREREARVKTEGAFWLLAARERYGSRAAVPRRALVNAQFGDLMKLAEAFYGVSAAEIKCRKRLARLTLPRHAVMHAASELLGMSLGQIARAMKRRDHTTVLSALRKNRLPYAAFIEHARAVLT